jgi:hypothetical protein
MRGKEEVRDSWRAARSESKEPMALAPRDSAAARRGPLP